MKTTIDALVEALEQMISCHSEPDCPAVDVARAALAQARAEQAEPKIRYCPECGGIGDVPATARDCCPDGAAARYVPKRFASLCREAFTRAYTTPPAAPVAKLEPLTQEEITSATEHIGMNSPLARWAIARAVEAAHNAKLSK